MSIRIVTALVLLVFAYPAYEAVSKLAQTPSDNLALVFWAAGYFLLIVYLFATGYNLRDKGKPW